MLNKILDYFNTELARNEGETLSHDQCQLATAALLIEVAAADRDFGADEMQTLRTLLAQRFELDDSQLEELTRLAEAEQEEATSLYQFTQMINQQCRPNEKYQLLQGMWEVAYADGNLDKYEEHLIRRVAELIHVPHNEFIRAKLEARK
ncbi:tellurite resistance TerB family protein [Gilvimarinus sp. F26214L]|uniref:tellurite resistance TerB family protein n=1 Tax=Gilvimarinus sp. DZF01 TaxID=3461371 RepID=UPI00404645BB